MYFDPQHCNTGLIIFMLLYFNPSSHCAEMVEWKSSGVPIAVFAVATCVKLLLIPA